MTKLPFVGSPTRVYLRPPFLIRSLLCAVAVGSAAACGGGGGGQPASERVVRVGTFAFQAPSDWTLTRRGTGVEVVRSPGAPELVSVSRFRTTKPYRPALFDRAVPELDRAARELAKQQQGELRSSRTSEVAGERVREYELEYERAGEKLRERIVFVFRGRTEYELLCQWKASDGEPAACRRLTETFTPL